MLIWVASYPRSGNTLTLLTLHDSFEQRGIGMVWEDDLKLGKYLRVLIPGYEQWTPPSELHALHSEDLLNALRERPEPFFIKTHRLREVDDPAPALYIVRDGRDAIVSQAHFVKLRDVPRYRELSYDERIETLIRPGVKAYGHWSKNVRQWTRRAAPTAVIRYEHLIEDPAGTVAAASEELAIPLGEPGAEVESFEALNRRVPEFFRRGETGGWRDEMNPRLQRRFWECHGTQMQALGYAESS